MVRTQLYLTVEERQRLRALARRSGRRQSELIRKAIDEFLTLSSATSARGRIRQCRGIWRGRSAAEFRAFRTELERRTGP